MKRIIFIFIVIISLSSCSGNKPIEVGLITGHTDKHHNWELMSKRVVETLAKSTHFNTTILDVTLSESQNIDFELFDVVVMNINEVEWCDEQKLRFEQYMTAGGGLVILHEANNAFPEWKAYNQMIGLGGWGGRNDIDAGPYYYYLDGEYVLDSLTQGAGGKHGRRVPFEINVRDNDHPITQGLPAKWSHTDDELYGDLRGPAENIHPLATAFSQSESGGTGKEELVLFTVDYHKGRVFHSVLGHTGKDFDKSLDNPYLDVILLRGVEWAATGEVNFSAEI